MNRQVFRVLAITILLGPGCKFPELDPVTGDGAALDGPTSDAESSDASDDASSLDAPPDSAPRGPLVVNNQPAMVVLGQPNFVSGGYGSANAQTIYLPVAIAADSDTLWVSQSARRVIAFTPHPVSNQPSGALTLGAFSFTDNSTPSTVDAQSLNQPAGVAMSSTHLFVVDSNRHRVLVWTQPPTSIGEAADIVIGQQNMTSSTAGNGANQLNYPFGVWTDGTRLVVGDAGNNRVLIWNQLPTSNGQAANVVIGQSAFGLSSAPATPDSSRLYSPGAVSSDGQRLLVADVGHNRVLIWQSFPAQNGQSASVVIGQGSFGTSAAGTGPANMNGPSGLAVVDGAVFVSDQLNDRVLVYDPIPTSSGQPATQSLGQPNPSTVVGDQAPSQSNVNSPIGLVVSGTRLYVADANNNRVLAFSLNVK